MTDVWFVLPDGDRRACRVAEMPRCGDLVRFAGDGEEFEVARLEHIVTADGRRHGEHFATILVRLRVETPSAQPGGPPRDRPGGMEPGCLPNGEVSRSRMRRFTRGAQIRA
jgi:hypothetical protein